MNVYYEIYVDVRKVNIEKRLHSETPPKIQNKSKTRTIPLVRTIQGRRWKWIYHVVQRVTSSNFRTVLTSALKGKENQERPMIIWGWHAKKEKENWEPQLEEISGCWQQPS